jgi:hypothetical protein
MVNNTMENAPLTPHRKREVSQYNLGGFIVQVRILEGSVMPTYVISSNPPLERIVAEVVHECDTLFGPYLDRLEKTIPKMEAFSRQMLMEGYPELPFQERDLLARVIALDLTELHPLAYFLVDERVRAIYVNRPRLNAYVYHSGWGLCKARRAISAAQAGRIVRRFQVDTGDLLDATRPSLLTTINTPALRFSIHIGVPPLAIEGFQLTIDKGKSLGGCHFEE